MQILGLDPLGPKMLNLGCGTRFLPEWTNVDFVSTGPGVLSHNLRNGIPFPNNSFKVVYHSHILEHFPMNCGPLFIGECFRVLKPGGVLRVVVPNLEEIATSYIAALQAVLQARTAVNEANYEWAMIELYDQVIRTTSGGEFSKYLRKPAVVNEERVLARVGKETWFAHRQAAQKSRTNPVKDGFTVRTRRRAANLVCNIRFAIASLLLKSPDLRRLLPISRFREQGETHQWMYDRYSLACLLRTAGFERIELASAFKSKIANWESHSWLDVESGEVRKPDSLFMEATKAQSESQPSST